MGIEILCVCSKNFAIEKHLSIWEQDSVPRPQEFATNASVGVNVADRDRRGG